jgi:dTDP-glucose 4,6-dehydratase
MKVLITGGFGFIGHHFVESLIKKTDWQILILDRASNKYSKKRKEDLRILDNKQVSYVNFDFATLNAYQTLLQYGDVDYIFHLGAKTEVNESLQIPNEYIHSNIIGTKELLDYALLQKNLKKFIYISTAEIFGPGKREKPFSEWSNYNCQSIYASTKAAGEELTLAYSSQAGIPVLIVHTMNVFGEREKPNKFIPQIIRSAIDNKTIPIYCKSDTGIGGRTYIDILSLIDALYFLLENSENLSSREKINIAGDDFFTNQEFAEKICQILKKPINIEYKYFFDQNFGHIINTSLDTSKLHQLGWKNKKNISDDLERVVAWWIKNNDWLRMK